MGFDASEWTILAPGPSIKALEAGAAASGYHMSGPIVAVTHGVLCPVRADFWAVQDHPDAMRQVWEPMSRRARSDGPVVWCRERFMREWLELGFRVWPHVGPEDPHEEEKFRAAYVREPAKDVRYTSLTVLVAVARAITYGARRIVTFGVDMAGDGYGYKLSDRHGRAAAGWAERWRTERQTWDAAIHAWAQSTGVTFVPGGPGLPSSWAERMRERAIRMSKTTIDEPPPECAVSKT